MSHVSPDNELEHSIVLGSWLSWRCGPCSLGLWDLASSMRIATKPSPILHFRFTGINQVWGANSLPNTPCSLLVHWYTTWNIGNSEPPWGCAGAPRASRNPGLDIQPRLRLLGGFRGRPSWAKDMDLSRTQNPSAIEFLFSVT